MKLSDFKILVLNADYQPVNTTSFKKGCKLVYKGKAEILVLDEEKNLVSANLMEARPKVIRLLKYIYLPYRRLTLTKQNILKRDGHRCGYCESRENLTLDHIIPKSRGGTNSWENLVTCCARCNGKKDNRTPAEAGMKLRVEPYAPTFKSLIGFKETNLADALVAQW